MKLRLPISRGLMLGAPLICGMLCTGCSTQSQRAPAEIEHEGGFRVSVKANGREVENFQDDLVHHVVLSTTSRESAVKALGAAKGEDALDHFGKRYGVRVSGVVPGPLGLRTGDVITAVGKKSSPQLGDLESLLETLKGEEEKSFTFDREGNPHKTILVLGKGGS